MTSTIGLARLAVILLFAIAFTMFGWLAPVMYASYVPSDMVIEKHSFTAEDATVDADQHYICFDRTVNYPSSGEVFIELYLVSDDDSTIRTEVDSQTMSRYFQSGRNQVVTPLELPKNLEKGEYRYLLVVRLDMANSRVTRDFMFTSDEFHITGANGTDVTEKRSNVTCG